MPKQKLSGKVVFEGDIAYYDCPYIGKVKMTGNVKKKPGLGETVTEIARYVPNIEFWKDVSEYPGCPSLYKFDPNLIPDPWVIVPAMIFLYPCPHPMYKDLNRPEHQHLPPKAYECKLEKIGEFEENSDFIQILTNWLNERVMWRSDVAFAFMFYCLSVIKVDGKRTEAHVAFYELEAK